MTFEILCVVAASIILAIDVFIAVLAFIKGSIKGILMGVACILAAVVDFSYILGLTANSYFVQSIFFSIYFTSVVMALTVLLFFMMYYCDIDLGHKRRKVIYCFSAIALVDAILFAINIFKEIVVKYSYKPEILAHVDYKFMPLYYGHLIYSYLLLGLILGLLIYKSFVVPKEYKYKYTYTVAVLVLLVTVNALFLFAKPEGLLSLDVSVVFYSIMAVFMYWCNYHYSYNKVLMEFRHILIDNLEEGMALFDIDDRMIVRNKQLDNIFHGSYLPTDMKLKDFVSLCGIKYMDILDISENYSFQCYLNGDDGKQKNYRGTYKAIRNEKDQLIGKIITFDDVVNESDALTGYHNWDNFKKFIHANPDSFPIPSSIVYCDINNLSVINSTYGRESGDMLIRELAQKMKNELPFGTYFIRGYDANLIAICSKRVDSDIHEIMENIKKSFSGTMQYAISMASYAYPDITDAILKARQGVRAKKLLDADSLHSDALLTFIRALKECDENTESHVKRTRLLGDFLGKRMGLNDIQLSNLGILCVMHDIGKIGIPLEILNKPGKLTSTEWEILKTHVEKGYQIAMSSADYRPIADYIRYHHERWDGNGYPEGLSKESIPILSRVIAVVDAFDAMINKRVYKEAMSIEEAKAELKRCAGTQFDPRIVAEFIQMLDEKGDFIFNNEEFVLSLEPTEVAKQISWRKYVPDNDETDSSNVSVVYFSKYTLDQELKIISVDDYFEELTGYSKEDIKTNPINQIDLIPDNHKEEYLIRINMLIAEQEIIFFEHKLVRKDKSEIPVICMGRQYFDATCNELRSDVIIANSSKLAINKMTEETEKMHSLQHLAEWERMYRCDSLTGLLNRNPFVSDVEGLLFKGERIAFFIIDADHFKHINDNYGHREGDKLLVNIAKTLKSVTGDNSLCCRLGGDEFAAAILVDKNSNESEIYQNTIQKIFKELTERLQEFDVTTGISMGAVISDKNINIFNQLYDVADTRLYAAKADGRGKLDISSRNSNGEIKEK